MRSNDIPATDAELDEFYGVPPTQAEINEAIGRHTRAFDKDDLVDIVYEEGDRLLKCFESKNWDIAGMILSNRRKQVIADRASYSLYGKRGLIKPSQVE